MAKAAPEKMAIRPTIEYHAATPEIQSAKKRTKTAKARLPFLIGSPIQISIEYSILNGWLLAPSATVAISATVRSRTWARVYSGTT